MSPLVKKILATLGALGMLAYVGYQLYMYLRPPMKTETITHITAYETLETKGVVFRDETILSSAPNGHLFYTVQNGGRIARGGKIAEVYTSQNDALVQQELDALDAEIKQLASINAQGTTNRANLTAIEQQTDDVWLSITEKAQRSSLADIDSLHSRLLTLFNKYQLTVGHVENYDDRLAELRAKRKSLAESYQAATGSVTSPVAGYFIGGLDGYESYCVTKGVTELTVDKVENTLNLQPQGNTGIGKIVEDYEWYLACVVPLNYAADLKMGAYLDVRMPFVRNAAIPMQIVAVNKDVSGKAAIVFKCMHMDQALSTARVEDIEIRLKQYDGLRVPDEAIRFNENQEPGVFAQVGNVLMFRRIEVLYHDENDAITVCRVIDKTEEKDKKDYADLYDKIAVEGENLYDGMLVD